MSTLPARRNLEQVFLKNRQSVQHYLYGSLNSKEDASDLLQECYLRLIGTRKPISSEEGIRAYLFTIARNLVIDLSRRRKVRGYEHQVSPEDVSLKDQNPEPDEALEIMRAREHIKRCILEMAPVTRKVFILSRFEELTYPEIAQRLSVSTRTVERRMCEAMALLTQHLDDNS